MILGERSLDIVGIDRGWYRCCEVSMQSRLVKVKTSCNCGPADLLQIAAWKFPCLPAKSAMAISEAVIALQLPPPDSQVAKPHRCRTRSLDNVMRRSNEPSGPVRWRSLATLPRTYQQNPAIGLGHRCQLRVWLAVRRLASLVPVSFDGG